MFVVGLWWWSYWVGFVGGMLGGFCLVWMMWFVVCYLVIWWVVCDGVGIGYWRVWDDWMFFFVWFGFFCFLGYVGVFCIYVLVVGG